MDTRIFGLTPLGAVFNPMLNLLGLTVLGLNVLVVELVDDERGSHISLLG
jgi:hypothetical protein